MDLPARLLDALRRHQVLTVAVTEPDGRPYAAALFYAADDQLRLYVLSDPATRHGQAMRRTGRVAGTIQRDRQAWTDAMGLQFVGTCRPLGGAERAHGWSVYARRFEFLSEPRANDPLAAALAGVELWCIEPTWMRLIDNAVAFAHKEEWQRGE